MNNRHAGISGGHCRIEASGDGTARLAGDLTFATVNGLFREFERGLSGGAAIDRIDLADVKGVDSAGLALLLEWQARRDGRELAMLNAPNALLRLARLCEADDLLQLSGREDTR